jgi:hypothetical protein
MKNGRLKCPKTDASVRAVPLQAIALAALDELPVHPRGGHPSREVGLWRPSAAGVHKSGHSKASAQEPPSPNNREA